MSAIIANMPPIVNPAAKKAVVTMSIISADTAIITQTAMFNRLPPPKYNILFVTRSFYFYLL